MNLPELHLDKSSSWRGLIFKRNGLPVDLETALLEGFVVSKEDANCVCQLVKNIVDARDLHAR